MMCELTEWRFASVYNQSYFVQVIFALGYDIRPRDPTLVIFTLALSRLVREGGRHRSKKARRRTESVIETGLWGFLGIGTILYYRIRTLIKMRLRT